MEYKENLAVIAKGYAESMFNPEDVNKPEFKDSIDSIADDFKAGANWAAEHKRTSVEKTDAAAREYALNLVADKNDADAVAEIAGNFSEGAEWYYVEIAQVWTKRAIMVDGKEGFVIEEKPTLIRKVLDSLTWKIFIGVILGLGVVWAFVKSIAGC